MARPIFTGYFEESENIIKNRMLGRVPEDWRKEPGDYIYDSIAPGSQEIKDLEINQDYILQNAYAQYASHDWLDLKLLEVGLTRIPATPNKRTLKITADAGVVIPKDHRLSTVVLDAAGNPLEFIVDADVTFLSNEIKTVTITSITLGTASNVPYGSEFILSPTMPGIRAIADNGTLVAGRDTETDDAAFERYLFKVNNPDTGGNKNDYIRWAEEHTGVGKAKCVPRWNGNGSVKVVLLGTDYTPASNAIVADVQNYLDPESTGLGNGKAPCGAVVSVIAASGIIIDVTASVTCVDPAAVEAAFRTALEKYIKSLAFSNAPNVIYNYVGALLSFTAGVINYTELKINNATADIAIDSDAVAVLGTVTI